MTTAPTELAYGYVDGRLILVIGDSSDAGRMPDPVPATGTTVQIAPKQQQIIRVTGDDPTTVERRTITCTVDEDGRLLDPAKNRGVWLVTGVYTVTYRSPAVSIPTHEIVVTAAHTEELPLDLTLAMPPGGPVLAPSEYAALSARIDALRTYGIPGPSAYEVWLDAGNIGTVDDYLAALKGDDGDPSTEPGPPGRGIASISDDDGDGTAVVTFTDGTTSDLPLPSTPLSDITPDGIGAVSRDEFLEQTTGVVEFGEEEAILIGPGTEYPLGMMVGSSFYYAYNAVMAVAEARDRWSDYLRGDGPPNGSVYGGSLDEYLDTLMTNGAVRWRQMNPRGYGNYTGWKVVEGDTGWRDITQEIKDHAPTVTIGGRVAVRRVNSTVMWSFVNFSTSAALPAWSAPSGFEVPTVLGLLVNGSGTDTLAIEHSSLLTLGAVSARSFTHTYFGPDNWPTTLPGTPA